MKRFTKERTRSPFWGLALSVLLFLAVLWALGYGVDSISRTARQEQLFAARQAVARAAAHCYAVEGAYPQNLAYLEEHYGLAVNQEKYAIHYNCFASNLMPDIDVIPRTA